MTMKVTKENTQKMILKLHNMGEHSKANHLLLLQQRIDNLENWVREEGSRSNVCTFNILQGEICEGCLCGRVKS
jgi:hypothetical protein